jgi:hypothetical protein
VEFHSVVTLMQEGGQQLYFSRDHESVGPITLPQCRSAHRSVPSWSGTSSLYPVAGHSLREEHRLRVFENRVLRRIFGPKTK